MIFFIHSGAEIFKNSRPDLLGNYDLVTNLGQKMETKNRVQQLRNEASND